VVLDSTPQYRHPAVWMMLLLLAITLLSYTSALKGGYIWDDDDYVTANRTLKTVGGLVRIWTEPGASPQYYPLLFTSFWVERHLWGLNPFGYHLLNVLLHACVACLLYYLLLLLEVPGAWLAALVFAVHPVNVETAAWISERKNVLSGCFYMLSAIALLRFYGLGRRDKRQEGPLTARPEQNWYWAGVLFFVCALLSKTVTCMLPAALLIVLWWKRGRVTQGEMLSLAPLFAAGAAMGLFTAWLERTHVGAAGSDWSLSFAERFLVAGRALCFYVWKLLWPAHLCFNYERWVIDGKVWQQYLYPLAAAAVLTALWLARRRIGRGPLAAMLFFVVSLFPALGFFDVFPFRYSYVADHFQYLACIGPITLFAAGAAWCCSKYRHGRLKLFRAAGALVIGALALMTWRQGNMYAGEWTLWNETLKRNPFSVMAHNNLGSILSKRGKPLEAMAHFEEALKVRPDFEITNYNISMTYYNRGVALAALGRIDEAMEQYGEALRVRPDFERALNNLGSLLAQKGRIEEAVRCWATAAEIKPDYAGAHYNLLLGYTQLGDSIAAHREHELIRKLDPALAEKARSMIERQETKSSAEARRRGENRVE